MLDKAISYHLIITIVTGRHLIKKLSDKVLFILRTQKYWRMPQHRAVLIYDRANADIISEYFDENDLDILDVRNESVNISVLVTYLYRRYIKKIEGHRYIDEYIRLVNPDLVITLTDNDIGFYSLKINNNKITTAFIQNGIRGGEGDVFHTLMKRRNPRYQVDYMMVFGDCVAKDYSEFISGTTMNIGSFKNNHIGDDDTVEIQTGTLLFISQYRGVEQSRQSAILQQTSGWRVKSEIESNVVKFLHRYCKDNKLKLKVCGRNIDSAGVEEQAYYQKILGEQTTWEYCGRENYSTYKNVQSSEFIVFLFSTVGYESLARGKRCASFCSGMFGDPAYRFGWPLSLPDDGPFWTNYYNEDRFKEVLDYMRYVRDTEWSETCEKYLQNFIEYDPGNKQFIQLIRSLGLNTRRSIERKEVC